MKRSLKKQLVWSLLAALLLVWSVTAWVNYKLTRSETAELFNAELAQSARVVNSFVETMLLQHSLHKLWHHSQAPELFEMPILGHKYERKIAFQLRSVKEGLLLRSESAPEFALSLTRNGYSETTLDGQLWHVFSISSENGEYVIHVGQRDDIRRELVANIANQQIIGFAIALPILGLLILWIVRRTLLPLNQLKQQLSSRELDNLQAIAVKNLPDEMLPVVQQINSLFLQLEQAFSNERNFSSDASHELKTPLAGIYTQLQVAQKTVDEQVRDQALAKAQQAVMRMTHMVQQLLVLSRVQQHNPHISKQSIALQQTLISTIADLDTLAHAKQIEIELQAEPNLSLEANPQLLAVLLRNLLDNAIKYSPPGSLVRLQAAATAEHIVISVEDSGPGVNDEDYQRLSQRFFRCVDTAASVEGSGLGLSIVQRIISLHGAELDFSRSTLGGLKVSLRFYKLANAIGGSALRADMV